MRCIVQAALRLGKIRPRLKRGENLSGKSSDLEKRKEQKRIQDLFCLTGWSFYSDHRGKGPSDMALSAWFFHHSHHFWLCFWTAQKLFSFHNMLPSELCLKSSRHWIKSSYLSNLGEETFGRECYLFLQRWDRHRERETQRNEICIPRHSRKKATEC